MTSRVRTLTEKTVLVAAIILATLVALSAAQLLISGQPLTGVQETPLGSSPSPTYSTYAPYPPAVIPLFSAGLLLSGLFVRKLLPLAWVGNFLLIAFSTVFLFSSGAAFLPVALLLLVLFSLMASVRRSFA